MKKLIILTIITWLFLGLTNSWAALSSRTIWEVRTTGNDTNGGGFVATPFVSVPSAPSVAMGGNNSVALDEYYTVITYVDQWGETNASAETYLNVNNSSTDTIVVTSPSSPSNGLGVNYKVYVGTVSGGPYYIQNGSGTAIGTNYSRTTTPATTGDQPSITDYSQQNSAQIAVTDAVTNGTTTITSATANFTQALIGNILYITGGTGAITAGWYEITSVTDSSTIIVDRSTGLTTGTGATLNVGGALATLSSIGAFAPSSSITYVKAGTYSETWTISVSGAPSGEKTKFWGYNTTRNDNPIGTNRPIVDGGSTRANCLYLNGGNVDSLYFRNFIFQNATGDGISGVAGAGGNIFRNVKSASNGGDGVDVVEALWIDSELSNNAGAGNNTSGSTKWFTYLHDNTGMGTQDGTTLFCISESNQSHGFDHVDTDSVFGSVSYNNTGASTDGFSNTASANYGKTPIMNNVSTSNGRFGFTETGAGTSQMFNNNITSGNASTAYNSISMLEGNPLTTDPGFTDQANGDFTYSASSSSAVGAGVFQTMPGATGDYQWNIGVDQDDNVTAGTGGGASFFSMN